MTMRTTSTTRTKKSKKRTRSSVELRNRLNPSTVPGASLHTSFDLLLVGVGGLDCPVTLLHLAETGKGVRLARRTLLPFAWSSFSPAARVNCLLA
jgi:hypothetical protein